jgi:23S rRNA (adenine1618-N6)-methyltransferase
MTTHDNNDDDNNILSLAALVSKSEHLPALEKALRRVQAAEVRIIDMAQGQKRSRVLAWRFGVAPF